ncbi:MAG: hypothetical protein A3K19_30410 [Lentisphaerae bacterium RIFOXYB12_FULL_65_16]|nr:MAG: hypothetical protein A3K18_18765 [Lentisphaerae bacterium RIFOXYA12_64_32]OGV85775.1 MAG: hypothetical protein A3K19_30410 [Lentisphaerae bacterium RIFOXYB12_FULL_65_16]
MSPRNPRVIHDAFFRRLRPGQDVLGLFDYLPEAWLFIKDERGRFMKASTPLVERLGFASEADLIGLTDYDMVPRYLADMYARDDRHVMASRRPMVNKTELVTEGDGTVAWHITSKVPLFATDGTAAGIAGVTRFFRKAEPGIHADMEIWPAIEHIHTNFRHTIGVGELSAQAGLSVSAFERKFKRNFHLSPLRYVRMVRIREACRALSGSAATISQIAQDTGFADQSHLTRDFTRMMGLPPRQYRDQHSVAGARSTEHGARSTE